MTLTACLPLSKDPPVPPPPISEVWPADAEPWNEEGSLPTQLHWRDYFVAPPLASLIETALANNRDLRLALLRAQEAQAAYRIQRADQFPTIGAGAQGTRTRIPADLSVTGQAVTSSDYQAFIGLNSWELDLWGRVRSLSEAALQEYLATDATQRAVRIALIAEVARAYIRLRELDERVALTRETIATRAESFRIFRRRNEVGSVSRLELTQAETLLIQAQTLGAQLEQARAAQAHALTLLLGTPTEIPAMAEPRLSDEAFFAPLRVGLPAELLTARPDIIAAEHRLKAAHANIHAARAAFFPRITLTGSFGTASAQLDGLFAPGSGAWSFAPTISLPIFDGGRRRAGLNLAEVRSDMAVADYERTIQTAFREVADALSSRVWLTRQVALQRQALEVQERRARLAQLRYDSGAAAYLEVLDAQRDLLEAQQQLAQVRSALLLSHVALYAALGGGSIADPVSAEPPSHSTTREVSP